jgi:hypothetical protein
MTKAIASHSRNVSSISLDYRCNSYTRFAVSIRLGSSRLPVCVKKRRAGEPGIGAKAACIIGVCP